MDLTWHNMSERFASPTQLKLSLIEHFSEYVPSTPEFHVGHLEGRGSQKRWIVRSEDLKNMYDAFYEGDEIKLWCEGKSKDNTRGRKRRNEAENEETPPPKRDHQAEEEREIRTKLEKNHSDKYTGPQYTLWANL